MKLCAQNLEVCKDAKFAIQNAAWWEGDSAGWEWEREWGWRPQGFATSQQRLWTSTLSEQSFKAILTQNPGRPLITIILTMKSRPWGFKNLPRSSKSPVNALFLPSSTILHVSPDHLTLRIRQPALGDSLPVLWQTPSSPHPHLAQPTPSWGPVSACLADVYWV